MDSTCHEIPGTQPHCTVGQKGTSAEPLIHSNSLLRVGPAGPGWSGTVLNILGKLMPVFNHPYMKRVFWCFSGISCISVCDYSLLSCHWLLMGITWPWRWVFLAWDFWRQISPVKAEVKVALSTSALSAPVQQQALFLLALAFAADMVVGALLAPLCILC